MLKYITIPVMQTLFEHIWAAGHWGAAAFTWQGLLFPEPTKGTKTLAVEYCFAPASLCNKLIKKHVKDFFVLLLHHSFKTQSNILVITVTVSHTIRGCSIKKFYVKIMTLKENNIWPMHLVWLQVYPL